MCFSMLQTFVCVYKKKRMMPCRRIYAVPSPTLCVHDGLAIRVVHAERAILNSVACASLRACRAVSSGEGPRARYVQTVDPDNP